MHQGFPLSVLVLVSSPQFYFIYNPKLSKVSDVVSLVFFIINLNKNCAYSSVSQAYNVVDGPAF
jgi:hypothetical protein